MNRRTSKSAAGTRRRAGAEPPAPAQGAGVSPFAEGILRHEKALRRCRKRLSEKSVHRLRIETRRLLAQLELLRSLIPVRRYRKARRGLRRQLRASTLLRDAQVQLLQVEELLPKRPELGPVFRHLEKNERCLRRFARRKLKGAGKLHRRLKAIEEGAAPELCAPDPSRRLREAVRLALRRASGRLAEFRAGPPRGSEAIHRLRVALKRFRYMAESLPAGLSVLTPAESAAIRSQLGLTGEMRDLELLVVRLRASAATRGRDRGSFASLWRSLRLEQSGRARAWLRRAGELASSLDAISQSDTRLAQRADPGTPLPRRDAKAPAAAPRAAGPRHP
jgi:CHAD domain-containing protein